MPYNPGFDSAAGSNIYSSTSSSASDNRGHPPGEQLGLAHVPQPRAGQNGLIRDSEDDSDQEMYEMGDDEDEYDQAELPQPSYTPPPVTPAIAQSQTRIPPTPENPPLSQVAVILHSSLQKEAYAKVEDEESSGLFVTLDLTRMPKKLHAATDAGPPRASSKASSPAITDAAPRPKKRGRTIGWTAGTGPYLENKGLPGARPKVKKAAGDLKRRARRPRNPSPTPRRVYLALKPKFVPFLCEWEGCPAQLQNHETLRRHVMKVHGHAETCKWGKCAKLQPVPQPMGKDELAAHMDKAHLLPCVWNAGDGPRNTDLGMPNAASMRGDADPLPPYLFDEDGHQVTPSIKDQDYENDKDRRNRQHMLDRLITRRDNNAPDEPQYTQQELKEVALALSQKKAKQKMFKEYRDRAVGAPGVQGTLDPQFRGILSWHGTR